MLKTLQSVDTLIFSFINDNGNSWLDPVMVLASNKLIWIPLYLLLVIILFRSYRSKAVQAMILVILVVVITDQVTSTLLKPLVQRERPCNAISESNTSIRVVDGCGAKYGFPSGHAANTMAVAITFLLFIDQSIGLLLVLWSISVGFSRIYLGVHYPGDVLAGWVIGTSIAWIGLTLSKRVKIINL